MKTSFTLFCFHSVFILLEDSDDMLQNLKLQLHWKCPKPDHPQLNLLLYFLEDIFYVVFFLFKYNTDRLNTLYIFSLIFHNFFISTGRYRGLLLNMITHNDTHTHIRYDSSGPVISPTQKPLLDNTQQLKETNIHAPGEIRSAIPASERPQTHALDRTATMIGLIQ